MDNKEVIKHIDEIIAEISMIRKESGVIRSNFRDESEELRFYIDGSLQIMTQSLFVCSQSLKGLKADLCIGE